MTSWPDLTRFRLKSIALRKKEPKPPDNPIEILLQPIADLAVDSSSDVSEISDVFEEFHKNSYLRKQANGYLTKREADVKTMDDFTHDFKQTMARIRGDLNIGAELLLESAEDVNAVFGTAKDPNIFPKTHKTNIVKALHDEDYSAPTLNDLKEMRKISDSSTVSMTWRMLDVNRDGKRFEITPPGFDLFRQGKPHWLEKIPVSWSVIEEATTKCENWLEEHCQ